MNKEYSCPNADELDAENCRTGSAASPVHTLAKFIGAIEADRKGVDDKPEYKFTCQEVENREGYNFNSGSMDIPEVIEYWKSRGVHVETRETGGGRWVAMVPQAQYERYTEPDSKLPLVIVFNSESFADPFWAMKTLDIFANHIERFAKSLDHMLVFQISDDGPDNSGAYRHMIREATQMFPGDENRVYIDVTKAVIHSISLNSIEGFSYIDDNGSKVEDLDSLVEKKFGAFVVNVTDRWA
ncbi:MAG: hypothetical protein ACI3VB_01170 [Oscillospiraceae bacterium]